MAMTLDSVDLAADPALGGEQLEWTDEWDWTPIAQEQERSLSGALLVQQGSKLYGRPITLKSNGGAWFTLATVRSLEVLRDIPGRVMPLQLPDGRTFSVIFDHSNGAPLKAKPLWRSVEPDQWPYEIELSLLTVAPPEAP
ncbi:hypothetical protein SAMN05216201_11175 [Pseudomonas linyingensis]|uniref:Uncharacterized protein n=1 Tax=Pseudomonas linyingensis TaxID=915471 RepID=A0A1H7A7J3_9PSED|nr:hypothetical protein [Pseudomonas linyingensis]SEJ58022.1 hypothetical protein SAMN05216201_11175 [Pseudomonas linyingensis]